MIIIVLLVGQCVVENLHSKTTIQGRRNRTKVGGATLRPTIINVYVLMIFTGLLGFFVSYVYVDFLHA